MRRRNIIIVLCLVGACILFYAVNRYLDTRKRDREVQERTSALSLATLLLLESGNSRDVTPSTFDQVDLSLFLTRFPATKVSGKILVLKDGTTIEMHTKGELRSSLAKDDPVLAMRVDGEIILYGTADGSVRVNYGN